MAAHPCTEAWNISAADYPHDSCTRSQLLFLLRYAILAPSSHNTQPWLFRIDGHRIELYADLSRSLQVLDPDRRQLVMSCGAALFNLRVAMRRFGREPIVELFPSRSDLSLLARITPGPPREPSPSLHALFEAIPRRRTNRQPFEPLPIGHTIASQLMATARAEGAWIESLCSDAKEAAAELIAAADRAQFHDRQYRRERTKWLVSGRSHRGDGIPGYSPAGSASLSADTTLRARTFDIGGSAACSEDDLVKGSPMLVVLGTNRDEPLCWFQAGQAVQRVLLEAQSHGISASFLNQALELSLFKTRFTKLLTRGVGHPHLVLRMGYGPPAPAAPRRSIDEVILMDPALAASA